MPKLSRHPRVHYSHIQKHIGMERFRGVDSYDVASQIMVQLAYLKYDDLRNIFQGNDNRLVS